MEDKVSGEDVNVELVYLDNWMLAGDSFHSLIPERHRMHDAVGLGC